MYPDENLNASVCLFSSFLIYVTLERTNHSWHLYSHVNDKFFAQGTTKLHNFLNGKTTGLFESLGVSFLNSLILASFTLLL
jgi:hypothetical protein